jgi:Lar family restriction alleviation protein
VVTAPTPCPFCGSTEVSTDDDSLTTCGETYVYAECGGCHTQGPAITLSQLADEPCAETYDEAIAKAIAAWNQRAPNGKMVFVTDDYIGRLAARARRCTELERRLSEMAEVPCVKKWGRHPMKCLPKDKCSFCRARELAQ